MVASSASEGPNHERKDGEMTKTLVLAAVMATALAAGVARAQTPWGGSEDGGFIPADGPTAGCENASEKAIGKAVTGIGKCHQGRAGKKLHDETGEENGECDGTDPKAGK